MILEQQRAAVNRVSRHVAARILDLIACRPLTEIWTLADELDRAGRDHADLVLALLSLGELPAAELVVGRPMLRLPPHVALCRPPRPVATVVRDGDDRLVIMRRTGAFLRVMARIARPHSLNLTATGRKTILVESPMYDRLDRIHPGMSLAQIRARGLRRRDIFIAEKRGWLVLEAPPAPPTTEAPR